MTRQRRSPPDLPLSADVSTNTPDSPDNLADSTIKSHLGVTSASVKHALTDNQECTYLWSALTSGEQSTIKKGVSTLLNHFFNGKAKDRHFFFSFIKKHESYFKDWLFRENTFGDGTFEIGAIIKCIFEALLDRKYHDQYTFALGCIREALDQDKLSQHVINLICDLICERKPPEEIIESLRAYLTRKGLDARTALNAWYLSCTDQPSDGLHKNLLMFCQLEKQQPGAAKILQSEFGIQNFGRYPIEALIAQCASKDAMDKPYGVVVYPLYDHNGGFFLGRDKFLKLYRALDLFGHYLRISEVGSKEDALGRLEAFNTKYSDGAHDGAGHKISFMVLGGHGEIDRIRLGSGRDEDHLFTSDFQDNGVMKDVMQFFVPNPTLILESCSTGQIGGIAHYISHLGAEVYAPRNPTHLEELPVSLHDGRLEFRVEYARPDAVMRYPIRGSY